MIKVYDKKFYKILIKNKRNRKIKKRIKKIENTKAF